MVPLLSLTSKTYQRTIFHFYFRKILFDGILEEPLKGRKKAVWCNARTLHGTILAQIKVASYLFTILIKLDLPGDKVSAVVKIAISDSQLPACPCYLSHQRPEGENFLHFRLSWRKLITIHTVQVSHKYSVGSQTEACLSIIFTLLCSYYLLMDSLLLYSLRVWTSRRYHTLAISGLQGLPQNSPLTSHFRKHTY